MDVNTRATHVPPYRLGEADLELKILYARIGGDTFGVLAPFPPFAIGSVKDKAHNMLGLL